jgi:hypothetical protein
MLRLFPGGGEAPSEGKRKHGAGNKTHYADSKDIIAYERVKVIQQEGELTLAHGIYFDEGTVILQCLQHPFQCPT